MKLLSEIIEQHRTAIRQRILSLSGHQRGVIWREAGLCQSHFYNFLRGNDAAAGVGAMDKMIVVMRTHRWVR